MAKVVHYSYKGKGSIHIRKKVPGAVKRHIGNCSKLEYTVEEETEEMLDYRDAGGGVLESDTQIKSVKGAVDCYDHSPENIALGMRGIVTKRPAVAVVDEGVTADVGSVILLERLQDLSKPITVKSEDGTTTYDLGVDFTRSRAGIALVLDDAGAPVGGIADGDELKVSYAALADSVIEAMAAAADDYEIIFEGLNDARSGAPVRITNHLAVFSPTKGLSAITDKFGVMSLEFTNKKDPSITGVGLSKYMKIEVAEIS